MIILTKKQRVQKDVIHDWYKFFYKEVWYLQSWVYDPFCNLWWKLLATAETVIYRIYYYINRSGNGHLTLRELKRGNLVDAMQHADEEEDINKVLRWVARNKWKNCSGG